MPFDVVFTLAKFSDGSGVDIEHLAKVIFRVAFELSFGIGGQSVGEYPGIISCYGVAQKRLMFGQRTDQAEKWRRHVKILNRRDTLAVNPHAVFESGAFGESRHGPPRVVGARGDLKRALPIESVEYWVGDVNVGDAKQTSFPSQRRSVPNGVIEMVYFLNEIGEFFFLPQPLPLRLSRQVPAQ